MGNNVAVFIHFHQLWFVILCHFHLKREVGKLIYIYIYILYTVLYIRLGYSIVNIIGTAIFLIIPSISSTLKVKGSLLDHNLELSSINEP